MSDHSHLQEAEEVHQTGFIIDTNVLLKMLVVAFAGWAGVVGWVGMAVVSRVDALSGTFQDYVIKMEKRVTILEEYQKIQDEKRDVLNQHVEKIDIELRSHENADAILFNHKAR